MLCMLHHAAQQWTLQLDPAVGLWTLSETNDINSKASFHIPLPDGSSQCNLVLDIKSIWYMVNKFVRHF